MARSRRKYTKQRSSNLPWIIGGVIAAVVVVGVLIAVNQSISSQPSVTPVTSAGKTWGDPNAPVKIEIYSDLQ